jgi:tRNA-uridine 2-sulfurtransferase
MSCKGLSLMSGGLDSQLAVRVLERAGACVEAVTFETPFFTSERAVAAAKALGVKIHVVDFLDDELALIRNPPHGFGGAMNPCIDCHATMIRRAGELMAELGYDFVATGEVRGQRPMSQNAQSLLTVEKASGLKGRLVRPLSAKFLEPTIPELEGKLDREKLLDLSGRARDRQIALAAEFGIVDYPSPAGGCKLTEDAFGHRLRDLMEHEGFGDRSLIEMLSVGRRFRLPDGTGVILGRNAEENARLAKCAGTVVAFDDVPGPTALVPAVKSEADLERVRGIVRAWSRGTTEADRAPFKAWQLT